MCQQCNYVGGAKKFNTTDKSFFDNRMNGFSETAIDDWNDMYSIIFLKTIVKRVVKTSVIVFL